MKMALDDWRSRFGFVMAKDIAYSHQSLECSARYVSKYACKGVFDCPFCCAPKSSEGFSSFLKRLRKDLHIPYGCFPYVFQLSEEREIFAGLSPSRQVLLSDFLFGRGVEKKIG